MADTKVNVRIQNKYDTEANWIKNDPILKSGEIAISSDKNQKYKVGDGTNKWSKLNYAYQADLDSKSNTSHTHDDRYYTESEINTKVATLQGNIDSHTGNKSNPHAVTKAQVGLGNCDNTADVNKNVKSAKYLVDNGTRTEAKSDTTANAPTTGMLYSSGMYMTRTYNDSNTPIPYGNIINLAGAGTGQLLCEWSDADSKTGHLYYRSHRDTSSGGWGNWNTILDSSNYNSYSPTLAGVGASGTWGINISGNSATTTKWATARTLTLSGSVTGSANIDGSGNVTLDTTTNHTHSYLPLSGGTLTGATTFNNYLKLNAWSGYGSGTANFWYDGNNKFVEIQTATDLKLNGTKVSKDGHTHNYAGSSSAGGSATKAIGDSDGNQINTTYLKLSGGSLTGEIGGGYINTHPEGNGSILPFLYNDLAFFTSKGGTYKVYYTDDTDYTKNTLNNTGNVSLDLYNAFDGSPSYSGFSVASKTSVVVIDLSLPQTFSYTTQFYIDFGTGSWKANNVTLLLWNSGNPTTTYTKKASTTSCRRAFYCGTSYSYVNSQGGTIQGFNRMRIVLTNFNNTAPRIAQIGLINYGSAGTRYTTMSRGIDDAIYRNITPNSNNTYSLGSSTKKWNTVYATTFNGNATTSTTSTKLSTSAGATNQPVYFSDGKPVMCTYGLNATVPSNAKFTDTNTWRGIQDNLTSTSTTDSLSANQGKVLKGLVDGKASSSHTHDDRYYTESEINTKVSNLQSGIDSKLPKSGGTLTGALNFANCTWNTVGDDVYIGDMNIGGTLGVMGKNGNTGIKLVRYGSTTTTGSGSEGVIWTCTGNGTSTISGTTSGTFSGNLSGNATTSTTASKLSTSAGSATQPIYFKDGVPTLCTYSLNKTVPSNAVFTDTNTWRPVQNNLTSTSTDNSLSAYQGKILRDNIINENILVNSNFCKSVNLRGVTASDWTKNKDMGIDYWFISSGQNVSVSSIDTNGLKLAGSSTNNGIICQKIPNFNLNLNEKYTWTIKYNNGTSDKEVSGSIDFNNYPSTTTVPVVYTNVYTDSDIRIACVQSGTTYYFGFGALKTLTFKYMKLECGSFKTPYVPPNFSKEYYNSYSVNNTLIWDIAGSVLDARQGKVLNDKFANYLPTSKIANNLTTTSVGYALDARQGKYLKDYMYPVTKTLTAGSMMTNQPTAFSGSRIIRTGNICTVYFSFTLKSTPSTWTSYTLCTVSETADVTSIGTVFNQGNGLSYMVAIGGGSTTIQLYMKANPATAGDWMFGCLVFPCR